MHAAGASAGQTDSLFGYPPGAPLSARSAASALVRVCGQHRRIERAHVVELGAHGRDSCCLRRDPRELRPIRREPKLHVEHGRGADEVQPRRTTASPAASAPRRSRGGFSGTAGAATAVIEPIRPTTLSVDSLDVSPL